MESEPKHLLDLIKMVKPRAAIFTTYTFSVSYFDAVFVPVLRSVGCQDIAVLVDAHEAARCSDESRSRAAGRIYRVTPVVAPGGGVFHPKVAYLASETDDVLAIGSGNLTASGQSIQLESFDSVSASQAPSVFLQLAEWMEQLALLIKESSPQAARLLTQSAPRARQSCQRTPGVHSGPFPAPSLIHTLTKTARESLEALFLEVSGSADVVVVLSPFHAPDGGPLLRLAATVKAKFLEVGMDGSRNQLFAPFESGRFEPKLPGQFVLPDTLRNNKRLHAKVFELRTKDKALVMTGSVNATVQSMESTKNVEVSLTRWVKQSPFTWKPVVPAGFEATLKVLEFEPKQAFYVDAWLEADRHLHGQLAARGALPASLQLAIHSGDIVVYKASLEVRLGGIFEIGPLPPFDTSKASLLSVSDGLATAWCWLNVHEELDMDIEERERCASIDRVLVGEYAAEDIAAVIRLLSDAAHGIAATQTEVPHRPTGNSEVDDDVSFSFMRWENSGRQGGAAALLGRNAYDLLKAVNRWMNNDVPPYARNELEVATSPEDREGLRLWGGEAEQQTSPFSTDPYALLDKLCLAIPVALARQPELQYGGLLAELVASRALQRSLKQDFNMAPCLSWLERFSRFSYVSKDVEVLSAVAVAMACTTAHRLDQCRLDPQLAVLRDATERFMGEPCKEERWIQLCEVGLGRDMFRRIVGAERSAVLGMSMRLAAAVTLDAGLLSLLRKATSEFWRELSCEPEAKIFPEVVEASRAKRLRKKDLLQGFLEPANLETKGCGCPLCGLLLLDSQVSELRRKHVLFHRAMACNRLLFCEERHGQIKRGIQELPDA